MVAIPTIPCKQYVKTYHQYQCSKISFLSKNCSWLCASSVSPTCSFPYFHRNPVIHLTCKTHCDCMHNSYSYASSRTHKSISSTPLTTVHLLENLLKAFIQPPSTSRSLSTTAIINIWKKEDAPLHLVSSNCCIFHELHLLAQSYAHKTPMVSVLWEFSRMRNTLHVHQPV